MVEFDLTRWLQVWGVFISPLWVFGFLMHWRIPPTSRAAVKLPFAISIWFGSLDGILDLLGITAQLWGATVLVTSVLLYAGMISPIDFFHFFESTIVIVLGIGFVIIWLRRKE